MREPGKPAHQELRNEPSHDIPVRLYQNPYLPYPNNIGLGPKDFEVGVEDYHVGVRVKANNEPLFHGPSIWPSFFPPSLEWPVPGTM